MNPQSRYVIARESDRILIHTLIKYRCSHQFSSGKWPYLRIQGSFFISTAAIRYGTYGRRNVTGVTSMT